MDVSFAVILTTLDYFFTSLIQVASKKDINKL